MKIKLKEFEEKDFKKLDDCMVMLQDFLVGLDTLKRFRRTPGYSPQYAENTVKKVAKYDGIIYLAYAGGKNIGCIAGIMEKQSKKNLLECAPTRAGRIIELFVLESYRGFGVGRLLMEKMENYLRKKKCDVVRLEIFKQNKSAHDFYKKLKYQDRMIDMIKLLK